MVSAKDTELCPRMVDCSQDLNDSSIGLSWLRVLLPTADQHEHQDIWALYEAPGLPFG